MIRLGGVAGALGLLMVITAVSAQVYGDDEDAIDYRKHVMKTMGEQTAIIGMILEGKAPPDDFYTHVRALAVTAATAKKAFESEVPGGDAKPEVWEQWPDFAERLDELAQATEQLAQTAEETGVAGTAPMVESALTCKGCHDEYRVPEE